MGLAIFRVAQRTDESLRVLYQDLFVLADTVSFDDLVSDVHGDDWGINSEVLEKIEAVVTEADGDVVLAMGDGYNHQVFRISFAFVRMAVFFGIAGRYTAAWERLIAATVWMGYINGRQRGIWEILSVKKQQTSARLLDGRHRENRSSREEAMEWYDEHRHEFTSDDDAAFAIAGKIVPMKFDAVRRWIREHKKAAK